MEIIESKKFQAAALATIIMAALIIFAGLTVEQSLAVVAPLLTFIGAQGLADFGKSRALVDAYRAEVEATAGE